MLNTRFTIFVISILLIFIQILYPQTSKKERKMEIKIESSAFKYGEFIPVKYTCDGENVSPPLKWSGAPDNTKSFALISDDPDAPIGDWVHWVMYNIPPNVFELAEKIPADKILQNGAIHGLNDFRKFGYGGPCPPSGVHRYFFKIYALDTMLDLPPGATKKHLLEAMKKHIIAQGELMGKYQRKR